MDDKEEKIVEEHSDEEEIVEAADELVKEKAHNEFTASENTAKYQFFVQNANFDSISDFKQILDLADIEDEKKYNLSSKEECAEFFSNCKNREYIILAIVLSVFELVPVGDFAYLKDSLTDFLPTITQLDKDGKEIYIQQTNPYLSLDVALSVVGGKMFIRDDGQKSIGYGENFEKVLSNIWIQFPDLRKPVIRWLLKVNDIAEYRTSFEVYQIVGAFIRIIKEDFQYAKQHMFDKLYSNPNNLGFLARLARELLEDKRFRNDTLNMVLKWTESESNWLWKSAFLICLNTYDPIVDERLRRAMINVFKKRMIGFQNSDLLFIVLFSEDAENVRSVVAAAFFDLYQSYNKRAKKDLALIYLRMVRYGYYQVNKSRIEIPFVTCDSKEQMNNICPVLTFIMLQYDLYRQLCYILQAYLEEIATYKVSSRTLSRITAFFYVLTRNEPGYQEDILLFLQGLKGDTAKLIYNKLMEIYQGKGGKGI